MLMNKKFHLIFISNGSTKYLNYAAAYGSIKCFKYLILNHDKVDDQTFTSAAYGGNLEIIKIVEQKQNENDLIEIFERIVAGVIGVGKPTFEMNIKWNFLFINMAQQMEHHGVPMQVHITRSVYELVYGNMFLIKERGLTEVKGGSVVTYLVSGRK